MKPSITPIRKQASVTAKRIAGVTREPNCWYPFHDGTRAYSTITNDPHVYWLYDSPTKTLGIVHPAVGFTQIKDTYDLDVAYKQALSRTKELISFVR